MVIYCYQFRPGTPLIEVKATLLLALIAIEGLHGVARMRLDIGYAFDGPSGRFVIDATTRAGADLAKVFTAFIRCEFGDDSFRVERVLLINANGQAEEVPT